MMDQYHRIKKDYQDAILFFRLGDFYEMFYEDAKIGSSILEIALTSRQKVPMCGVPYHAADSYMVKLLRHGYKVAICEQVGDPKLARGVVKRDVVKVLTPGTAVEVELEEGKENNFIASIYFKGEDWGIAAIDLASGQMKTYQDHREKRFLEDELFRISPREIVFPSEDEVGVDKLFTKQAISTVLKSPIEDWAFDFIQARDFLLTHFQGAA